MLTVIIAIHLMLVLALIGVVLLQKSEGGGLVSSTGGGFLSSRGTANVLTRTTAFIAAGFFLTSLLLSWLAGLDRKPASIINTGPGTSQQAPGGGPVAPPGPSAPSPGGRGGVLDQLQPPTKAAPAPSPAPSGPQVPQSK